MTAPSRMPSILDVIDAPGIWRRWFKDPRTWEPWRAFLSALFGLPLDDAALELFRQCTGSSMVRSGPYAEAWLIVGRRGGKSMILALIAVFLAVFRDWRPFLSPGETGTIKIIACDRRQARVIHRYCRALLRQVPMLAPLVARDGDEEIELTTGVVIEVATASFRSIRGFTVIAALLDEIAFWRTDDSANPDQEIFDAIRPAMATVPGSMLLAASSPYARRGVLYQAFRRYHGQDDAPALVWKAPTRVMNPTVPERVIAEAVERDPASAAAEYGAEFRADIEQYISREVIDAATAPGRFELPPQKGVMRYFGFVDPSGGSSDSMALAIAHEDPAQRGRAILDAIREIKPPFSPESVVAEFAALLQIYNIRSISGDRYAGEWPRERFREHRIEYVPAEKSKSDTYRELLPLLNSGKVELLDQPRLALQLSSLERRTGRGTGRDIVDHPPGSHDDVANAVAGAIVAAVISITDWERMAAGARRRAAEQEAARAARGDAPVAAEVDLPAERRRAEAAKAAASRDADVADRARRQKDIRGQLLKFAGGDRGRVWGRGLG
jgi:hypothetical protein